jgi:RAT1-interacting protein
MIILVARQTITTEGTWRISRKKGSSEIFITKLDDHGTGNILSTEFLQWRQQLVAQEVAQLLK